MGERGLTEVGCRVFARRGRAGLAILGRSGLRLRQHKVCPIWPLTSSPTHNMRRKPTESHTSATVKMAPPSKLTVATSSVTRLIKEEASYHKELEQQNKRIKSLEENKSEDENAEYQLKQEVRYRENLGFSTYICSKSYEITPRGKHWRRRKRCYLQCDSASRMPSRSSRTKL